MPTVAQILNAREETAPPVRYGIGVITNASKPIGGVSMEPSGSLLVCRIPLDMNPAEGDKVLVLICAATTVALARLETK